MKVIRLLVDMQEVGCPGGCGDPDVLHPARLGISRDHFTTRQCFSIKEDYKPCCLVIRAGRRVYRPLSRDEGGGYLVAPV